MLRDICAADRIKSGHHDFSTSITLSLAIRVFNAGISLSHLFEALRRLQSDGKIWSTKARKNHRSIIFKEIFLRCVDQQMFTRLTLSKHYKMRSLRDH